MTFSRDADSWLREWFEGRRRKPLILRGARQTGKTTAVRRLSAQASCYFELNLERREDLALIRTCGSAADLIERLQQHKNLDAFPPGSLLFLDEIQEHAEALTWLRFFFEDHPEIAVVAAGSLMEVRLRNETLSFPVGRVEFMRLEPLTFLEFLRATHDDRLAKDLSASFNLTEGVDRGLHDLAMQRFSNFLIVGGLPEAVDVWRSDRNLVEVRRVHDALRQAYVGDLVKYGVRAGTEYLEHVLARSPAYFGSRFKLRHLGAGEPDKPVRQALELLERAMVVHRVTPTSSRGLPLVPRSRSAHKLLPLDIGLAVAELSIRPERLVGRDVESILDGRIAEFSVGVQLLAAHPRQPRSLAFWTREGSGSSHAEVDYLVPTSSGLLPVEVKSGSSGALKSLHSFLVGAEVDEGIRLFASPGGIEDLEVMARGQSIQYRLHSIPLYLAELLPTL